MPGDARVEFARDAADGGLVADIGGAEPAGTEAAQVASGFDQAGGPAHARGLNCGRDAGRRTAINAEIGFDNYGGTQVQLEEAKHENTGWPEYAGFHVCVGAGGERG